ncbi:hypothetical protein Pmani_039952 [Petrolisthes manimaculis]|uniref:Uncharacterized protein n=1 Tax=Petrolisthes manimaculis TaxID=1843537 RepID=A0AAE1ND23_9EUCA|nr:hypothetical protein Pmani_039952 [Petrolisthes manimaculis]
MVQEHVYAAYPYLADPFDRKSTYKAMETNNNNNINNNNNNNNKRQKSNSRKSNTNEDIWGPIFKNKNNFVDMHLC